jgi:hypothetical protein
MEYMFTFLFKGDLLSGTIEYVDSKLLGDVFFNESVAATACPK